MCTQHNRIYFCLFATSQFRTADFSFTRFQCALFLRLTFFFLRRFVFNAFIFANKGFVFFFLVFYSVLSTKWLKKSHSMRINRFNWMMDNYFWHLHSIKWILFTLLFTFAINTSIENPFSTAIGPNSLFKLYFFFKSSNRNYSQSFN